MIRHPPRSPPFPSPPLSRSPMTAGAVSADENRLRIARAGLKNRGGLLLVDGDTPLHRLTHTGSTGCAMQWRVAVDEDRKSTRLNSSHGYISYAVFCLKKKKR